MVSLGYDFHVHVPRWTALQKIISSVKKFDMISFINSVSWKRKREAIGNTVVWNTNVNKYRLAPHDLSTAYSYSDTLFTNFGSFLRDRRFVSFYHLLPPMSSPTYAFGFRFQRFYFQIFLFDCWDEFMVQAVKMWLNSYCLGFGDGLFTADILMRNLASWKVEASDAVCDAVPANMNWSNADSCANHLRSSTLTRRVAAPCM